MKLFIPISDDDLYSRDYPISERLVPFHIDYPCFRWLGDEPIDLDDANETSKRGQSDD